MSNDIDPVLARKVTALHQEAMRLAHRADDEEEPACKLKLARRAHGKERMAAELCPAHEEPSRSILYKSAGWLAIQAGDLEAAKDMARQGLAGDPPDDIRWELNEVLTAAAVVHP